MYFCVLALPMGEDIFFYAGMLLWLMLNLCSLRPMKALQVQTAEVNEIPETEAETSEVPPAEPLPTNDEILSWLENESVDS